MTLSLALTALAGDIRFVFALHVHKYYEMYGDRCRECVTHGLTIDSEPKFVGRLRVKAYDITTFDV
jgi:hypothetical protein